MPDRRECTSASPTISRYRLSLVREGEDPWLPRTRCRFPRETVEALYGLISDEPREVLGALFLDARASVIGYTLAYHGTLNQVYVEPRGILVPALLANAASIIIFHNHPSGDPTPSNEDFAMTRRLQKAGAILGVNVRDHLILGDPPSFYSILQTERMRCLPAPPPIRRAKPKYRHPKSGETWAGRGHMARWLRREIEAGATLEDFKVGD